MVRARKGPIVVGYYWSTVNRRTPNATCCLRPLSFTTCFSFWSKCLESSFPSSNLRTSAQASPILWNLHGFLKRADLFLLRPEQTTSCRTLFISTAICLCFLPKRLESLRVGTTSVSFLYSQCLAQCQGQSRCSMTNTYICWIKLRCTSYNSLEGAIK